MSVVPLAKRPRVEQLATSSSSLTVGLNNERALREARALQDAEDERSSNLQAPIMLLSGHQGAIFTFKFSPNGEHAASGSSERCVFLWEVYGDCANYNVLKDHKNTVVDLAWCDGRTIVSASADKTLVLWDAHLGRRKKKFTGHTAVVNSVSAERNGASMVSGGDDSNILLWDQRVRTSVHAIKSAYAVTAVSFSEDAQMVFSGGLDEKISAWDLRMEQGGAVYELLGHNNTVTGLALSPDGTSLLSNGMDSQLHCWDVRPYANPNERLLKTFVAHKHDFHKNLLKCAWSPDGEKVSCGSSDQVVHIWDVDSSEELYHLPGHRGCVNEVDFHPTEPIVGSCSSDKNIFLGEIK